ncbi:MAG: hypothetical protein AAF629_11245 [Chloroflexota bacterium]
MANRHQTITYSDTLLSDNSVHRVYNDGREEWREKTNDGQIRWRDNQGQSGFDTLLGDGVLKRSYTDGRILYGREQGYGRTVWGNGITTINQTSFGGKVGTILTGLGAGVLLGQVVPPPQSLTLEEEEALRELEAEQRRRAQANAHSGGDGSSDYEVEFGDDYTFGTSDSNLDYGGDDFFG